jgi:hypothetical protein
VLLSELGLFFRYKKKLWSEFLINQIIADTKLESDFYFQLQRIEYQASRVRKFALDPYYDKTRDPTRKKGVDLMTTIINFLNSVLEYCCRTFSGTKLTIPLLM